MQPRRQPGGVVVPVQHVEGRRRIAQQIVVDPIIPDQVVRPHPGEHARELAALDHAGELRGALRRGNRVGRYEDSRRGVLRDRHVEHAHRNRRAVDLALAARGEVGQERRHGDAAGARTPDVDVFGAGDGAHHVDRFLQRFDIGIEPEMGLRGRRILPGDGEGLQAALKREADDALLRNEVEYIVFVDLRRRHQERPRVHLRGGGPILDQLHDRVAVNHGARGRRQVLAHREVARIDLRRQAAIIHQVMYEIFQPMREAAAAGVDEFLQRCGIAGERVGRRHRVDEQRGDEAHALGIAFFHPGVVDETIERPAPGEVALRQRAVGVTLCPGRIGEAFVGGAGREFRGAGGDAAEFAEKRHILLRGDVGMGRHLAEQQAHRIKQVLAADADQGIGGKRIRGGLFANVKVIGFRHGLLRSACRGSPRSRRASARPRSPACIVA